MFLVLLMLCSVTCTRVCDSKVTFVQLMACMYGLGVYMWTCKWWESLLCCSYDVWSDLDSYMCNWIGSSHIYVYLDVNLNVYVSCHWQIWILCVELCICGLCGVKLVGGSAQSFEFTGEVLPNFAFNNREKLLLLMWIVFGHMLHQG